MALRLNGNLRHGPTLLSKQRTLGRGDAALTVSALSLGMMGMQGGRGRTPPSR